MELTKEAISVRLCYLNGQLMGRGLVLGSGNSAAKRYLTRETLLDALTTLYEECNNEALKKNDEFVSKFVDKYRPMLSEIKKLRVNIRDFDVKDLIGRGHFGQVHVVREKCNGDIYAMKILKKDVLLKHQSIAFFEEERDIMASSNTDWLVKLQYAFQDVTQLYLVMEYCPGGDLAGLLERRGKPLVEKYAIFYISEIIQALKELHMLGFVHRDLKPDNILIDRCGHLKLADFGSAAKLSSLKNAKGSMPIGTTEYISPEILMSLENPKKFTHGTPCDYWSLGIVAYELVTCLTPFTNPSKNAVHIYKKIIEHGSKNEKVSFEYPDEVDNFISDDFKELVSNLLHPIPSERPDYLSLLTCKVFDNTHWNSLRNQVPPFVPILKGQDDISNFSDIEKQKPELNVENFKTKTGFNGKNLPFIGFTYNHDINPHNYGDIFKEDSKKDTNTTTSSGHSSGSRGSIFNTSINGTVICMSNSKESEKLLELRKKEIDSLHKQLAVALSKQKMFENKENNISDNENQRLDLEKNLAEMACQNQKLQHQLELEHKEREILETKSLQLIRCAKKKWKEKTESQILALQDKIDQQELNQTEYKNIICDLEYQLKTKNDDYKKCLAELDALKKFKEAQKENMEKSRRLSRTSFVDAERISQETKNQMNTLTKKLNAEIELRMKLESQLALALDNAKLLENREHNLLDNFRIEKDIHMKEIISWTKKYNDKCLEFMENENLLTDLKNRNLQLSEENENLTRHECELMKQIRELQRKIENDKHLRSQTKELSTNILSIENQSREKDEQIYTLKKENSELKMTLEKITICEEKHKERMSTLEDLVNTLQQNVIDLEKENAKNMTVDKSIDNCNMSTENIITSERVRLLQEQVDKLEDQLRTSREECIITKEELKKTSSSLWRKEKQFSDCDLDRRFAEKELKEVKEHLHTIQSEKRNMKSEHEKTIKDLQESIESKNSEMESQKESLSAMTNTITELQEKLKNAEGKIQNNKKDHSLLQDKMSSEIKSLKETIQKLESDIHLSEERRSKVENLAEDYCKESKASENERHAEREKRIKLEVLLQERVKECDTLQKNYKVLQETCTVLEEQLIDFEKLIEIQDKENSQLKADIVVLKKDIEKFNSDSTQLQRSLDIHKFNVISHETKYNDCLEKLEEERSKNSEMEKQINNMLKKESSLSLEIKNKGSEIAQLNSDIKILKNDLRNKEAENRSLKEECTCLLTDMATLREDNMGLQHELKEYKENLLNLQNVFKEREEEFSARLYYWQECETKAEATIAQHLKLIDFLQTKVEEASKKKKTFSDMLFGKSSNKENFLPSTPQTPMNIRSIQESEHFKAFQREKSKSFAEPRNKFSSFQEKIAESVPNTPRNSKFENIKDPNVPLLQGFLKVQRGDLLVRVHTKLFKDTLIMKDDKDGCEREFSLHQPNLKLHDSIDADDVRIVLSDSERMLAFKISDSSMNLDNHLLIVCSSLSQKKDWIANIQSNLSNSDDKTNAQNILSNYIPNVFMKFDKNNTKMNFILEINKHLYFIGTNGVSYCVMCSGNKMELIEIPQISGIKKARIAPIIDQIVFLNEKGKLEHSSLRQFTAFLKATQNSQNHDSFKMELVDRDLGDDKVINLFEMSLSKVNNERQLLCASTSSILYFYEYEHLNMRFTRIRSLKTEPLSCIRFTKYTVIVGSRKFYEIDLSNFKVEEFIDPSDTSLLHAVNAHKNNILPSAIIQTKDVDDKSIEYLLCFDAFGIFIDEYGQRSRKIDVKWTHNPFEVVFRKPYLFIIYSSSVEIIHLDNELFQGSSWSDSDSINSCLSSLRNSPKKICIELCNVNYLGKSFRSGSIFLSCKKKGENSSQIVELDANDICKNKLGLSIDTLDTVSCDNESNKDLQNSLEVSFSLLTDTDVRSIEESPIETGTDFSSKIREKAKIINSLKQENSKINAIQNMLSKRNDQEYDSDESDTSSTSEDLPKNHLNGEGVSNGKKRVRFN